MFALHTSSRSIENHCEAARFHLFDPLSSSFACMFTLDIFYLFDAAPLSPFRPTPRCQNRPKSNLKSTAVVRWYGGAEAHSHKNVRLLLNLGAAAAQMYRPLCEIRDDMMHAGRLVRCSFFQLFALSHTDFS